MYKAFTIDDNYNMICIDDQDRMVIIGKFVPELRELLAEEFGSQVAQLTEVDSTTCNADAAEPIWDSEDEYAAELVADLELLGDDGDPGDRILPEEFIRSGDPVEDEGLTPLDAEELVPTGVLSQVVPPQDVYVAYFVNIPRSTENPWGSRDSFAGLSDATGMSGSTIRSLPFFFQVVAALPRGLRGEFRNFVGRDGRVHTVQMKDRPYVIARAGDIDDAGNFVPGVVDEKTGERKERFFVIAAWSLYNIHTGERFPYQEPQAIVRLNQEFKQKVFARVREKYPHLFASILHPRKHLGVKYWRVDMPEGDGTARVAFRFNDGSYRAETVQVRAGEVVFPATQISSLLLFALQAVAWKLTEQELAGKGVSK